MAKDAERPARAIGKPGLRSLAARLLLAFALVSVVGVGLAALLSHLVTVRQFEQFFLAKNRSEFVAVAASYYESRGSWDGVADEVRRMQPRALDQPPRPPAFMLIDDRGVVVSPADPYAVGDRVPAEAVATAQPVMVRGRMVGSVLDAERRPRLSDREEAFLDATNRALSLAALGAVALALVMGAALARTLTRPLRELTDAVHAMARGDLGHSVPVRSADELGELSQAFNRMSADLARSNAARRQMTADIAHDLRTPLTVITGYIEALRDGVLGPTQERFDAMYTEAQHLTHLVEDLRTLSLADADELPMQRQSISPGTLLDRVAAAFARQADERGVALDVAVDDDLPEIDVDPERMTQVLGNLMSNALRHTPSGGRIVLAARHRGSEVELAVQDDGEGIEPDVLPHVFDRSFRADPARAREADESGLGLAIARSVVRAHGGEISARSDGAGRGSTFSVLLPAGAP